MRILSIRQGPDDILIFLVIDRDVFRGLLILAVIVDRQVMGDPIDPARKAQRLVILVDVPIDLDEHLLQEILGILIPDIGDPQDVSQELLLIFVDDLSEYLRIREDPLRYVMSNHSLALSISPFLDVHSSGRGRAFLIR